MKLKKCPKCGESDLGDIWKRGRKLQQVCYDDYCDWEGKPRTPEKQRIKATKTIITGYFSGFYYEVFDRYGHIKTSSRFYDSEKEAMEELHKELERGKTDENAGPYTAVLWPATVKVKGKRIK